METAVWPTTYIASTNISHWHGDAFALINRMSKLNKSILFYVCPDANFPTGEVAYYKKTQCGWEVSVNFMGLLGHHGVLPSYYQSLACKAIREKNYALSDFLSLFQNRFVSLYYQAWLYARPTISYSLTQVTRLDKFMMAIAGVLQPQSLPHKSLLRYAILLRRRPLSRGIIETILADHFNLPIKVEDFKCCWLTINKHDMTRIGSCGVANELGCSTVLGNKVRHQQSACDIVIGPLKREPFESLLPGTQMRQDFMRLVRYLIPLSIRVQIRLVLHCTEVPWMQLNRNNKLRLGLTTWCRNKPFTLHQVV
jgi:type VI secretion system protein ImpH